MNTDPQSEPGISNPKLNNKSHINMNDSALEDETKEIVVEKSEELSTPIKSLSNLSISSIAINDNNESNSNDDAEEDEGNQEDIKKEKEENNDDESEEEEESDEEDKDQSAILNES